jgi:hypothetical protein
MSESQLATLIFSAPFLIVCAFGVFAETLKRRPEGETK